MIEPRKAGMDMAQVLGVAMCEEDSARRALHEQPDAGDRHVGRLFVSLPIAARFSGSLFGRLFEILQIAAQISLAL